MPLSTRGGKILRVGIDSPVTRVYPRESDGYTAQLVCRQIFEPPFDSPAPGQPSRPLIFEEGLDEIESGARTFYCATLRPGLRFSDGSAVTPEDVVSSLAGLEAQSGIRVGLADDRVLFEPAGPRPNFHLALTQTYWALARVDGERVLGTGPFRMAAESAPDCIRLERNPHFRDEVPLDGIEFRVYPPDEDGSRSALVQALAEGAVDLTTTVDQKEVAGLERLRKWFDPGSSTCNLYFNTRREPMSERRVRQAVALGINRLDLSAAAYGNALAFAAKGPVPPVMGEWLDGFRYDAEEAARRLAALDVDRSRPLRMLLPWAPRPYLPNPRPVIDQIRVMLEALGLAMEPVPTQDIVDFRRRVLEGDYDLALLGWNADTPDPVDFLETSLASHAIPEHEDSPVVKANWSCWSSEAMDAALEVLRAEPSRAVADSGEALLALLSEEVPMMPLLYGPTFSVHSYRVRNFAPNPFGIPSLAEVDLWT